MIGQSPIRTLLAAFAAAVMFGMPHSGALAHGGLSMDKDVCRLKLGSYAMHFTGYQPQATGSKEFCEDIPQTGQTVVVLDAIDAALREMPIEVRIVQDAGENTKAEPVTVLHLAAQRYPTGSVSFEHTFERPGKFVGLVTAGDKGEHVSRFPFSVASAKPAYEKYLMLLVVPFLGFALYRYAGRARRASAYRPASTPTNGP